jgi:hypothetical protein
LENTLSPKRGISADVILGEEFEEGKRKRGKIKKKKGRNGKGDEKREEKGKVNAKL